MTINTYGRLRTDRGEQGEHLARLNPELWGKTIDDVPGAPPMAPDPAEQPVNAENALATPDPTSNPESDAQSEVQDVDPEGQGAPGDNPQDPSGPAVDPSASAPQNEGDPAPQVVVNEEDPTDFHVIGTTDPEEIAALSAAYLEGLEPEPEDDEVEGKDDFDYDPAEHSVESVLKFVGENPDLAGAVLALEKDGKERVTLIDALQSFEAPEASEAESADGGEA